MESLKLNGYTVKDACEALGFSRSSYYVSKQPKAAKEYQKEEEAKLLFMQDVLKRSVRQAYDQQEVYMLTESYYKMREHFDIMVYVKKKQVS